MNRKTTLNGTDILRFYYNILPDLPFPPDPPLHPGTCQPISPGDLAATFPMQLIEQEVSSQREIPIPEEVIDVYRLYRPTPLLRALSLEKALATPARIHYKYEGASPVGSHKPNTALTAAGRAVLERSPNSPGSLGIAISEAIEQALEREDTRYSLGSVLNHVLLHQTVIGLEARQQLDLLNEKPDVIIGCHGGGSNFGGLALPFVRDKINGADIDFIAVEPESCPTLTKGKLEYDFGDTAGTTPLMRMYTLGHEFIPPGIHAGGLRYHGAAPIVSKLLEHGLIRAQAVPQESVFESALLFARAEGIVPAPESLHAIDVAIKEAIKAREEGKEKVIVFNLSGHGLLDMQAYDDFLHKKIA